MKSKESRTKRVFLGWDGAILQLAVERLFRQFVAENQWDLSNLLIVLPSGVAVRRLQELLAVQAELTQTVLIPPELVTVGQLPEHLYVAKFPFASDMVQVLTWCRALEQVPRQEIEGIFPIPSGPGSGEQLLELGRMLATIHRELASDRLGFQDVVDILGPHPESRRWQVLVKVQAKYLELLDTLHLWDVQTARVVAIEHGEPATDRRIILLAAVDLNRTQRGFVEALCEQCEFWIPAPASMSSMFDAWGCLVTEAWEKAEIQLAPEMLLVGNSPSDQCELTAACLAEMGDRYSANEITLGVPDSSLIPLLEQHLARCNVVVHYGPGTPIISSEPVELLRRIGAYLRGRNTIDFSMLIRHPSVGKMISRQLGESEVNWLVACDKYLEMVFPRLVSDWVRDDAEGANAYSQVTRIVETWLARLRVDTLPIDAWPERILAVLSEAYSFETCDFQDPTSQRLYRACQALNEQVVSLCDVPESLRVQLSANDAIDWVTIGLSGKLIPETNRPGAIEMLGWLDVPLDDAPALVLTGIHDGVVPESINADPFLPNQLRRQLGMMDNSRRLARDMFATTLTLHSRKHVRLVVGRTDAIGNPLIPSRILLACPLAELPARVLRLTTEENVDVLPPVAQRWPTRTGPNAMPIPAPISGKTVQQVSVTALRTYLACPYRFYLQHVLKLRVMDAPEAEMDAGAFGDLIHETLQSMHGDPIGVSQDAKDIEQFLRKKLMQLGEAKYGPFRSAAINVQFEQAQERLAAFAEKQAEWIKAGWITEHVEAAVTLEKGTRIGSRKTAMKLIGRIDRIDYHPQTKRWAVWDYKSSDAGTKPIAAHIKASQWTDLQLPLYRHLVKSLGIDVEPDLGYILLPKVSKDCQFIRADFTPKQLQEADSLALDVLEGIAHGRFTPWTEGGVDYDDYHRILQVDTQVTTAAKPSRIICDHREAPDTFRLVSKPVYQTAALRIEGFEDSVKSEIMPLPALMIRASAGTGKTFQLSNRLLFIILSGQSIDHVLATTFTRKAAGEIMQRVLSRLANACLDTQAYNLLAESLPGLEFDQADCLVALRRVARNLHRFRVSTLDSFYSQLARTFSLELQLPPGWSVIDPVHESSLRMQAIQRMLDNSDLNALNDLVRMLFKGEQRRNIARQIEETVQVGYEVFRAAPASAWAALAIPSSPSEDTLKSAVLYLEGHDPGHKSFQKELQKVAQYLVIGDWESLAANSMILKGLRGELYYGKQFAPELIEFFKAIRRKCAAELLPARRAQSEASHKLLTAFDAEYMQLVRRQRVLSFGDVTYLLAKWVHRTLQNGSEESQASQRVDPQQLKLRLDCGVDHLLLDEFQDTAPNQWQILEPLAQPLTKAKTLDKSFFCVGDTKQAIYGWRGGVAEIFDSVNSSLENIEESQLNASYRSSPEVIDFVNQVFRNLGKHDNYGNCMNVAVQWSREFPEHKTARTDLPGYVLLRNTIRPDSEPKAVSTESVGGEQTVKESKSLSKEDREYAELSYAADRIQELAQNAPGRSIGVLFRQNDKVALMIELLKDRGVSASQEGGNPLTDSVAIQLILSLVHLAEYPGDTRSFYHIQHSPLWATLSDSAKASSSELSLWLRTRISRNGLLRTLSEWTDAIAPSVSWWDQHRMKQLIAMASEFEASGAGGLRDFERMVEEQRVALPSEAQVKVMTVHASKGLEFDAVFLPNLTTSWAKLQPQLVTRVDEPCGVPTGVLRYMGEAYQELLPEAWKSAFFDLQAQQLREMLCVLYVAITRARSALYLLTTPRKEKSKANDASSVQEFGAILQSIFGGADSSVPEAILYEAGKADWYRSRKPLDTKAEQKSDVRAAAQETPIALRTPKTDAPSRGFRILRPSALQIATNHAAVGDLFSPSEVVGAAVGSVIHACFEQVRWIEDYQHDRSKCRQWIVESIPPEQLRHVPLEQVLDRFELLLKQEVLSRALSRARYSSQMQEIGATDLRVENERRINCLLDRDTLVDGTIDRLVVLVRNGKPVAAEVLDYKTDHLEIDSKSSDNRDLADNRSQWISARLREHRPQLDAYAEVVAKMLRIPREMVGRSLLLLAANEWVEWRN